MEKGRPRRSLTGGGEDSVGTVTMMPVAACSGTSGWTRRQGVRRGSASLKMEGKHGGREKGGHGGGGVHFNGDRWRGAKEGGRPGMAPRGEEVGARRGGSRPIDERCPAGSGPREGADSRARAHSAGWLCRLTGGPGRTVPGGVVQTGFEIKSKFIWFITFSNCFKF
jgi:hypothetical protein